VLNTIQRVARTISLARNVGQNWRRKRVKVSKFISYVKDYPDYTVMSDSGWECSETDIDAAVINHKDKCIILLTMNTYTSYEKDKDFEMLYKVANK